LINLFLEKTPRPFPSIEMAQRAAEKGRTPYVVVCLQESERMNVLLKEIRNSLNDLDAGLKGTLNMTEAMEKLAGALSLNNVPQNWFKVAYHSNKSLLVWLDDLNRRVQQFVDWSAEFETPNVVWLSGLFNPMSYLTAIMQVTARKDMLPLDDMCLKTEVLNVFEPEEQAEPCEAGAFIYGLSLEGAGWELGRSGEQGYLCEMLLKELSPTLPIVHVTAIRKGERVSQGQYQCPVYFVTQRGQGINNIPNFVTFFSITMESEDTDEKYWILSGVALFFAPEQPL
jgi:dynein heavy chain